MGLDPWYLGNPAYIYDLITETELDIPELTPDNTALSSTCWSYSPSGQFVTVVAQYNLVSYAPNLVAPDDYRERQGSLILILDTQGTVQHTVAEPAGSPTMMWGVECPFWQSDEQAIVFIAWDTEAEYVMRYSLMDQQMTPLYETGSGPDRESYIRSPLIPSPNGNYIALSVTNMPYGDRQVAVLYPDGEIRRIPNDYRFSLYPLWVPPLSE